LRVSLEFDYLASELLEVVLYEYHISLERCEVGLERCDIGLDLCEFVDRSLDLVQGSHDIVEGPGHRIIWRRETSDESEGFEIGIPF
jgi:hypothetical protein